MINGSVIDRSAFIEPHLKFEVQAHRRIAEMDIFSLGAPPVSGRVLAICILSP